jgi:hypothetical protein
MSQVTFAVIDRLQFRLAQAEFDIQRLLARVTALEGGQPLAPDQTTAVIPAPAPEPATNFVAPSANLAEPQQPQPLEVELNILSGQGMTAGQR